MRKKTKKMENKPKQNQKKIENKTQKFARVKLEKQPATRRVEEDTAMNWNRKTSGKKQLRKGKQIKTMRRWRSEISVANGFKMEEQATGEW